MEPNDQNDRDEGPTTEVSPPDVGQVPDAGVPPWGEDFDPGKAWSRIQGQKADLDKVRAERDQLKAAAEQAAKAQMSDLDKALAERDEHAKTAHGARRELWALRAALKAGLDLEDVEYLRGETAEEYEASAARFAARHGTRRPSGPANPKPVPLAGRGGTDPTVQVEETDPRALAARIPRGRN